MLKLRVLSALVLIPLFLLLLLKASPGVFCIVTAVIVLIGAWEWSFFMGITTFPYSLLYPFFMLFILIAALLLSIPNILYVASIWWIAASILVMYYPKGSALWGQGMILRAGMGVLVLVPCWLALNFIRNVHSSGPYILFFLFFLIWSADTGAYFVGRQWGKHKLAPLVSPSKTWEGLGGALICSLLIALLGLYYFQIPVASWPAALLLSLMTVLFSVFGDLFESMLKRNVGLKDSGNLIPGHGGILDRMDSITAAAPIFAVGTMWIGKISH